MQDYIIPDHLSPNRFQEGLHFVPMDTTGMVELTFIERFKLLAAVSPSITCLYNPYLPEQKVDIGCALDNNRIPTHRGENVALDLPPMPRFNIGDTSTLNELAVAYGLIDLKLPTSPDLLETVVAIDFNKAKE